MLQCLWVWEKGLDTDGVIVEDDYRMALRELTWVPLSMSDT